MTLLSFGNAGNSIQDDGACALADALKRNTTVHTIDLSCMFIYFVVILLAWFGCACFVSFLFEFFLRVVSTSFRDASLIGFLYVYLSLFLFVLPFYHMGME